MGVMIRSTGYAGFTQVTTYNNFNGCYKYIHMKLQMYMCNVICLATYAIHEVHLHNQVYRQLVIIHYLAIIKLIQNLSDCKTKNNYSEKKNSSNCSSNVKTKSYSTIFGASFIISNHKLVSALQEVHICINVAIQLYHILTRTE